MGVWSDIIKIEAPESAVVNETVNVKVTVKNKTDIAKYILVTGYVDGGQFPQPYAYVAAGGIGIFEFIFQMQNRDVFLQFWSYVWIDGVWQPDDYKTAKVSLKTAVEAFSGFTISGVTKV